MFGGGLWRIPYAERRDFEIENLRDLGFQGQHEHRTVVGANIDRKHGIVAGSSYPAGGPRRTVEGIRFRTQVSWCC